MKQLEQKLRFQIARAILEKYHQHYLELTTEELEEKLQAMMENEFRYFRGANIIFSYDYFQFPMIGTLEDAQLIQGDLHVENFGIVRNGDGELEFNINDFDEVYYGDWTFDVTRMLVSLCKYAQLYHLRSDKLMELFLDGYFTQLKEKDRFEPKGLVKKLLKKAEKKAAKPNKFIGEDGRLKCDGVELVRIKTHPLFTDRYKDFARKFRSGTASIGLDRFYALRHDGIIEEIKQAVLPAAMLMQQRKSFLPQEQLIVKAMQLVLGEQTPAFVACDGFYGRERLKEKTKLKPEQLTDIDDVEEMVWQMGVISANAHMRLNGKDIADKILEAVDYPNRLIIDYLMVWSMHLKSKYQFTKQT